jgi:DNA-binding NarL/FixJ family response regulator
MNEQNMLIGEQTSLPLVFGDIRGAGMSGNAIGTNVFERRELGTLAAMRSNGHPTAREMQVLACASEGKSNKMIANYLGIHEPTIKTHMSNVMRKLNASDRTQAVVLSIRSGWI